MSSSTMSLSVAKSAPLFVGPCKPTPTGTLPLSALDKTSLMRSFMDLALVFKNGNEPEPAKAAREALSRVLVHYYPLAGRLVDLDAGDLMVHCSGEGVCFIEATVDCTLEDVRYFEDFNSIPRTELLPYPDCDINAMLHLIQVTKFNCGGFIIGMRTSHVIADAVGMAQYLNAFAEISRGSESPSIKPIWRRDLVPRPPRAEGAVGPNGQPPLPPMPTVPFEVCIFDIPQDYILVMKNRYVEETGERCSTFEILAAKLWQCRIRASKMDPEVDVHLSFFADVRHLLPEVLPKEGGYYGNCIHPVKITVPSKKVAQGSIFDVMNLIRDGKKSLAADFENWLKGCSVPIPPLCYEFMAISDLTRAGFTETEYGWGKSIGVLPPAFIPCLPLSSFVRLPGTKAGMRLFTHCIKQENSASFRSEMMDLS